MTYLLTWRRHAGHWLQGGFAAGWFAVASCWLHSLGCTLDSPVVWPCIHADRNQITIEATRKHTSSMRQANSKHIFDSAADSLRPTTAAACLTPKHDRNCSAGPKPRQKNGVRPRRYVGQGSLSCSLTGSGPRWMSQCQLKAFFGRRPSQSERPRSPRSASRLLSSSSRSFCACCRLRSRLLRPASWKNSCVEYEILDCSSTSHAVTAGRNAWNSGPMNYRMRR